MIPPEGAPEPQEEFVDDIFEPEDLDVSGPGVHTAEEPAAPGPEEAAPGEPSPTPAEPSAPPESEPVYNEALGRWQDPVTHRMVAAPENAEELLARQRSAAPGAPPATPAATEQPAATTPSTTVEPFQYRAGGQAFMLEGSELRDDGVFVPRARLPVLAQILAAGHTANQRVADLQREIDRARRGGDEARAQANHFIETLRGMAQDPEKMARWLDNLVVNWPLLEKEAELAALKAQREHEETEYDEFHAQREAEQLEPACRDVLQAAMDDLAARPEFQTFSSKDFLAQLWDRMCEPRNWHRLFIEGKREELADQIPHGVLVAKLRNGNIIAFDPNELAQEFKFASQLVGKTATAVSEAQRANQEAVATSAAPPAVPAGGTPAPAATEEKIPEFKNQEEFEAWWEEELRKTRVS